MLVIQIWDGLTAISKLLHPCRDIQLNMSRGENLWIKGEVSEFSQCFDEGIQPKLDRGKVEDRWDLQDKDEEQAGVNYSYYRILIVETAQPLVNSPMHPEPTTSFYVIPQPWGARVMWVLSYSYEVICVSPAQGERGR